MNIHILPAEVRVLLQMDDAYVRSTAREMNDSREREIEKRRSRK